jgi:hypothetical protein
MIEILENDTQEIKLKLIYDLVLNYFCLFMNILVRNINKLFNFKELNAFIAYSLHSISNTTNHTLF